MKIELGRKNKVVKPKIEKEKLNIVILGEKDNLHYTTKIDSDKTYAFNIENHTYKCDRKALFEENSFVTKMKNKFAGVARTWFVFFFEDIPDPITLDSEWNAFPKNTITTDTGEAADVIITAKNILNCVDNNLVLEGLRGLIPKKGINMGFLKGKAKWLIIGIAGITVVAVFVVLWQQGLINIPTGGTP